MSRAAWAFGVGASFVSGIVLGAAGGAAIAFSLASAGQPPRHEVATPAAAATPKAEDHPSPEPTPAKAEEMDPEKAAFLAIVRKNAQDPSDLEILRWGEIKERYRPIKFRCKLVGYTRQVISYKLGQTPPPVPRGNPVMLEEGSIEYRGNKIEKVWLSHTYQTWDP